MIDPHHVTATGVKVLEVLKNTGEGGWTVARLQKGHETYLGFRWNGAGETKGYPTSRGYPVWVEMPTELAALIEGTYKPGMAVDVRV